MALQLLSHIEKYRDLKKDIMRKLFYLFLISLLLLAVVYAQNSFFFAKELVLVESIERQSESYKDIIISDNYLYATTWSEIHIFDISNPTNVRKINSIEFEEKPTIAIQDNILFVSAATEIITFDIHIPTMPVQLDRLTSLHGPFKKLFIHDSILYGWENDRASYKTEINNWSIFDVHNPDDIQFVNRVVHDWGEPIAAQSKLIYAYFRRENQTIRQIIDTSDYAHPLVITQEPLSRESTISGAIITEKYEIVSFFGGSPSFIIYENKNPPTFVPLYEYRKNANYMDLAIDGNYLYLTDILARNITVFDLTNINKIKPVASWELPNTLTQLHNIVIANEYVYVNDTLNGIYIFETFK